MKPRTAHIASCCWFTVIALTFFGSCVSQRTGGVRGPVGSAELELTLPNGSSLETISYAITHASGYRNTGDVPVTNSTIVTFQVGNIPAREDYAIALSADSASGQCSAGPITFDI